MTVFDIGCGTGELMEYAARKGTSVNGIDSSKGMLFMAQKRFKEADLGDKVELHHARMIKLDRLIKDKHFDRVMSTFVFSEPTSDEREWAYKEITRVLKDSGTLVLVTIFCTRD